jgi:hypothetical protein
VHLQDQPELVKLSQQRILPLHWVKPAMYSTAQIKWITKAWLVFSKVLLLLDLGDASMSSTDLFPQYCPYVLYNSVQSQLPSKLARLDSFFKVMRLPLIQVVVLSLP